MLLLSHSLSLAHKTTTHNLCRNENFGFDAHQLLVVLVGHGHADGGRDAGDRSGQDEGGVGESGLAGVHRAATDHGVTSVLDVLGQLVVNGDAQEDGGQVDLEASRGEGDIQFGSQAHLTVVLYGARRHVTAIDLDPVGHRASVSACKLKHQPNRLLDLPSA